MPNVDDHGLEVLKKAARNIGALPKQDYALQAIIVADESAAGIPTTPQILNFPIALANTEEEITLPVGTKSFFLKARKISRLRLAFAAGETMVSWTSIPLGAVYTEPNKIAGNKIYVQSDIANNLIEIVCYI